MSKLNKSSTTKRIKSTTWLDRICLCDKPEKESCDEAQPMIVQDGELKKISTRQNKTYLPCNYSFCDCCCNHWSKDTGLGSDSEMVMSECFPLNNRHLQIDPSDSSITEEWKKEVNGSKRRSIETLSAHSPCISTPIIPESLTSLPSDLKEAFEKWYHSHFANQHDSDEIRNQKSKHEDSTASYRKPLRYCSPREKICRFASSKCSYDETETHYQYFESGSDVEINVPDEKDETRLECSVNYDSEEDVFSYEDDRKSVRIESEERGSLRSPHPDHPVESNESSDRVIDNRRRTRKRGAKHGKRPTRNAVLSFLRSLSRRRHRSCSRKDDDRVSNIASRYEHPLSVQKCDSSSDDSIPYCARNRRNVKHKLSVKRMKNSKNLSTSVPTLNITNQHKIAKYHSEKALDIIVDEENESKNVDPIEKSYAGGDNTVNKISFSRDKEMKDMSTNCNETYFVHEGVQCNLSDDTKRCAKKEDIFHPLVESKKTSEEGTWGSSNLHEEAKTSSNPKDASQADSVIAVETNGVEGPHYIIPKPSASKSEGSFFIRFDPAIHETCAVKDDKKRRRSLRETESCFNLKSSLEISNVSVLYTKLNIKSDTESQSGDELTELLKNEPIDKIKDKTHTMNQKSEQSGFTKPSKTISSPGERQSYGTSESHSPLADTTTEEQLLSKKNSKKKHKLLRRISSIFKKRKSRSRGLTEKGSSTSIPLTEGLPQIHCSPGAPAVTAAAAVGRGRNRHSSPGSRVSGSRSTGGGHMAVGTCRKRLSVARHPAAVATATTTRRIVATGPHPRPLPEIRGKRIMTKHRNHTLPFLILDSDDEYDRQVALREMAAERRSRYRMTLQSPRRVGNAEDLYCPWREFQTWR